VFPLAKSKLTITIVSLTLIVTLPVAPGVTVTVKVCVIGFIDKLIVELDLITDTLAFLVA